MSKGDFFATEFKLVVLSEDEPVGGFDIHELAEAITTGDCSGQLIVLGARIVEPAQMAKLLIGQGSDPEFFGLDNEGNRVES